MVGLIGIAAASERGVRRIVGVEAIGINACPVRAGPRPRPRERAAARGRLRRRRCRAHPRARPDRDPQPARARNALRGQRRCRSTPSSWSSIVESSMSSPIYELLKRPGRALRRRARAPAATLRRGLGAACAQGRDRPLPRASTTATSSSRARSTSRRSTRTTSLAERHGTVGELRAELECRRAAGPPDRSSALAGRVGAAGRSGSRCPRAGAPCSRGGGGAHRRPRAATKTTTGHGSPSASATNGSAIAAAIEATDA